MLRLSRLDLVTIFLRRPRNGASAPVWLRSRTAPGAAPRDTRRAPAQTAAGPEGTGGISACAMGSGAQSVLTWRTAEGAATCRAAGFGGRAMGAGKSAQNATSLANAWYFVYHTNANSSGFCRKHATSLTMERGRHSATVTRQQRPGRRCRGTENVKAPQRKHRRDAPRRIGACHTEPLRLASCAGRRSATCRPARSACPLQSSLAKRPLLARSPGPACRPGVPPLATAGRSGVPGWRCRRSGRAAPG